MQRAHAALLLASLLAAGSLFTGPLAQAGDTAPSHMELVKNLRAGGGGLWLHGGYAISSALGDGLYITDVRDPENPVVVSHLRPGYMRDVDVIEQGARTIAVVASGASVMYFVDVTVPADPVILKAFNVGATVHNLAVFPGTSLVYNSRSGQGGIDIVDGSDPANPHVVKVWHFPSSIGNVPVVNGGCHDITIYPAVHRAYCAALDQSMILDVTDPLEPVALGMVTNPLINLHHWALPSPDHKLLFIGDEYGGSLVPACWASVTAPVGTVSTPTGAIWLYDISDPALPVLQSWISPPALPLGTSPSPCTAHFGALIPGTSLIAAGWYQAGVLLVDYSNPLLLRIVDQWRVNGVEAWDVKYQDGHLFTGDINRGFDDLRLS